VWHTVRIRAPRALACPLSPTSRHPAVASAELISGARGRQPHPRAVRPPGLSRRPIEGYLKPARGALVDTAGPGEGAGEDRRGSEGREIWGYAPRRPPRPKLANSRIRCTPHATCREGGHLCGPGDDYPGPERRKGGPTRAGQSMCRARLRRAAAVSMDVPLVLARRKLDNMTGRESWPQGAMSIGGAFDTGLWHAPGFMA
jgi:hypothetical protein